MDYRIVARDLRELPYNTPVRIEPESRDARNNLTVIAPNGDRIRVHESDIEPIQ